ncbi:hypothetical protein HK104_006789 [Borealophlyctis nickersoniae]|nr:hypothetical protein HK104_006789 [Borealophlyctis nickersoniae]
MLSFIQTACLGLLAIHGLANGLPQTGLHALAQTEAAPKFKVCSKPDQLKTIVLNYYAAVDSRNASRLASLYTPDGSLQFNLDPAAVGRAAIQGATEYFFSQLVESVHHTEQTVFTPRIFPAESPSSNNGTCTVASSATPVFTVRTPDNTTVDVPTFAASFFVIDDETGELHSVHNAFTFAGIYAAKGLCVKPTQDWTASAPAPCQS